MLINKKEIIFVNIIIIQIKILEEHQVKCLFTTNVIVYTLKSVVSIIFLTGFVVKLTETKRNVN